MACTPRRCCPPAPAPLAFATNCEVNIRRVCEDGTGIVPYSLPGGYLFVAVTEEVTYAAAEALAQSYALAIARYHALNQILTCNTVSENDLADCGLVEERPGQITCTTLCDQDGNTFCDEDGNTIAVSSPS
jgi:hypothetical protein